MFGDYNGAIQKMKAKGPWPVVSFMKTLRRGSTSPDVVLLRTRLEHSGDLIPGIHTTELFDVVIEKAVMGFQARHGLKPDGVVGPKTVAGMNVTLETRVTQLSRSKPKYDSIPTSTKRVIINIPAFQVWAHRNQNLEFTMDCIVGRVDRKTALFSDIIEYADFRPYWSVPESIFKQDKLPIILREGPSYLEKHGFEVIDKKGKSINPYDIDWEKYMLAPFPYTLRQKPGPTNALGLVKYMFPNKYAIYMHDTPEKNLFTKHIRAFSSGCCRLINPPKMGAFLLDWTEQQVIDNMNGTKNHYIVGIPKEKQVPVFITYIMAWIDQFDMPHYGVDIYGYGDQPASIMPASE